MSSHIPPVSGLRPVDLDPALINAVGLHHTLSTAIADLVDNSLDATAGTIRIRYLLDGTAPVGLQIVDDGTGMDATDVDKAMTFAGTRAYSEEDLGHFGVGLKAASLSQADTVLVYSRKDGSTEVGRQLVRSGDRSPPRVGVVSAGDAAERLAWSGVSPGAVGTVVEWRNVRTFPSTLDPDERMLWLDESIRELRSHLGLVLHRILPDGGHDVVIETVDIGTGSVGVGRAVEPIDPFGYRRTGDADFPQELVITLDDGSTPIEATAHVWPARSQEAGFRIGGEPGGEHQGFFVYRRNRLMQIGGWSGLYVDRPKWDLARVEIDLTPSSAAHVTINPEKSSLVFSEGLKRAIEMSTCAPSQLSFQSYLERAAGQERTNRSRQRRPVTIVEPVFGLPPTLLEDIGDTVAFDTDHRPVKIKWRKLAENDLFAVDLAARELVLNVRYRPALVGPSLNPEDAPLLKTLMFLLLRDYFAGEHLGDREKRELEAWRRILLSAVRAEADVRTVHGR